MYRYDEFDHSFVQARVAEFRDQVERRLAGEITEDQFKPLRLMNGVYLQLHAYMLRVAIPYGTLSSRQMRMLAHIARTYDKGYGHFTTRQNIQYNWPSLADIPAILDDLASVEMHAIQTSGNCIRNVTADHFAGAAADEVADPRPYAEILRQWSSVHPEFSYLPRKFKIAVTGAERDRAAIQVHDIGLHVKKNAQGELGFAVYVGGGQGRTPMIAKKIRDFLPEEDLLAYCTAILRVYNLNGRRDNKYKARIKITVNEMGLEEFSALVDEAFARIRPEFKGADQDLLAELQVAFEPPALPARDTDAYEAARAADPVFRSWSDINLRPHFQDDHAIAMISLKPHGGVPGDASADQMRLVAALARKFGNNEIRVTQEQNLVLPHVAKADLPALHAELKAAGLATANVGLASDIIACPGMDYCALATARSIPIAQQIAERLEEYEVEVGEMAIKISGCINACGHHHLGDIGILGLDRAGVENYQITLGGDAGADLKIGDKTGPGFGYDEVTDAIERLILAYLDLRAEGERFRDTIARTGAEPFKAALYEVEGNRDAA